MYDEIRAHGVWIGRSLLLREADLAAASRRRREKRAQRIEHLAKIVVMAGYSSFDCVEPRGDLGMSSCVLPKTNERADNEYTHLDSTWTVQDGCRHEGTMLGEHPGQLPATAVS